MYQVKIPNLANHPKKKPWSEDQQAMAQK